MRFVIQRVKQASVRVNEKIIGEIGAGLLVFVGIAHDDTVETGEKMVQKLAKMRVFEDQQGKTNLSLKDIGGELLIISQFTLYADCKKGNRPSFIRAGSPDLAKKLYETIIYLCKKENFITQSGEFGADMKVELLNDGPFTIILDSTDL